MIKSDHTSYICYDIEHALESGPALVLFARHSGKNVVIKILQQYRDTRYSLETRSKRQKCLLEALEWNRKFTNHVYIGLGRIDKLSSQQVCIDNVIEIPADAKLDSHAEYALLMNRLPDEKRLDNLLSKEKDASLGHYMQTLLKYIAHMHESIPVVAVPDQNGTLWGSGEQLQKKLEHNIDLFQPVLAMGNSHQYQKYDWLKDALRKVINHSRYVGYFEQRVQEQRIKRCHGDLKCSNIWITERVQVLDSVDFNPMYCNIDILSDFAMLVVDVQARTKSSAFVDLMIEEYLRLTRQQNEVARSVLAYYLVEKAIVGAAISIVYDNLSDLGVLFLELAEQLIFNIYPPN